VLAHGATVQGSTGRPTGLPRAVGRFVDPGEALVSACRSACVYSDRYIGAIYR
jgi:hypothetical protein